MNICWQKVADTLGDPLKVFSQCLNESTLQQWKVAKAPAHLASN